MRDSFVRKTQKYHFSISPDSPCTEISLSFGLKKAKPKLPSSFYGETQERKAIGYYPLSPGNFYSLTNRNSMDNKQSYMQVHFPGNTGN